MDTLEGLLAEVIRVRDCPATRRLCLDCWTWSQGKSEAEGLSYAAMLLDGVKAYQAHQHALRRAAIWNRTEDGA